VAVAAPCLRPSEFSVPTARTAPLPLAARPLLELAARPEFYGICVMQLLVLYSHFAVGPFPGLVVFRRRPCREPRKRPRQRLSSGSAFLQSLARLTLAEAPLRLLSWASGPFSTFQIRGSTSRGLATPATVRLQGLTTLLTAYAPRTLASLVSCRQRSWDL
jgi:hypothetical protein